MVFAIELVVQMLNRFGIIFDSLMWYLFNLLPSDMSSKITEQQRLQAEYLKCRADLHATSSQDEFAKWAKLRRHHDKMLAELETKKAAIEGARSSFNQKLKIIRWVGTRGLQQVIGFWYRKEALFWLPAGWFPYHMEWIMSWPSAPLGSISIVMWSWACAGFVSLVADAIGAAHSLRTMPKMPEFQPQPSKESKRI